ncbi:MAG: hypothetical protein Kow00127_08400 [Bacteroidales bacterium]
MDPAFTYSFIDDNHVRFTNSSTGEYHSLIWDFGNGSGDTTTDKSKSYVAYFPVEGVFTARLTITNNYGESKTSSNQIEITNNDLVVSFNAEIDPEQPNYVVLTNTTTGEYDSFKWVYQGTEVEDEQVHTAWFPYAGAYDIHLVVRVNSVDYSHTEQVIITQDDPNIITNLVWADEFDYTGLPDPDRWNMEIGGHGWGNNELQYYTNSESNASVANGVLTITAREESYGGKDYTSARLTTQDKFSFRYGKIEARIKMPYGQGLWPAFWMLGSNINSVGWPACGEIDIVELIGGEGNDNKIFSTLHWDNNGEHAQYGQTYSLTSGIFADQFHTFSLEWTDQTITSYVDSIQYFVIDITPAELSEFHENFFMILNLAVGGNLPGPPNASTVFPQTLEVDYVRVYELDNK